MNVFVDTSAFVAVLTAEDENHAEAARIWTGLLESGGRIVTTNYVVVETCSLLHNRFGIGAVRNYVEMILPMVLIHWVDATLHISGISSVLASARRGPSIVDCVSFAAMRRTNVRHVFAFDPHFVEQGFTIVNGSDDGSPRP